MKDKQEIINALLCGENPFAMPPEVITILRQLQNPFASLIRTEAEKNYRNPCEAVATYKGKIIASSKEAVPADGSVYFRKTDVHVALGKNKGTGWCAMRYWATQWDIQLPDVTIPISRGGAFSYEEVPKEWKFLEGYIAFQDPRIEVQCYRKGLPVPTPPNPVQTLDPDYLLQTVIDKIPHEFIPFIYEMGKFSFLPDEKVREYFAPYLQTIHQ